MEPTQAPLRPPRLTGFVGPLRDEAAAALGRALAALIDAPEAQVSLERSVSIATPGPTRALFRKDGAVLGLVLRPGRDTAWQAGPLAFTVEPLVEGRSPTAHPTSRAWLVTLGRWFSSSSAETLVTRGHEIAALHHRWATLHAIHDRDYRHVERAHSGHAAFLRPSFRCNQDCHFCWEGRDWPDPPDALIFTWLDELAATGATQITFCGGEPTLHRRLPELVARARTAGMRVHLHTNAIRFKDPAYTQALREAGMQTLLVSFHSADEAVSDRMTRARGTWKRTVEGVHALLSAGLTVAINCVVERDNVEGLEEHARFVRREFVEAHAANPVRMVNYSQPGRYYDAVQFEERMVPIDEARPHVVRAARVLHEAGVLLEITGTCGFPSCIAAEIPDLAPWRSNATHDPTHASGRERRPDACQRCAARDHCVGLRREYLERFGARGLIPFERLPRSDWYERAARAGLGGDWAMLAGET